MDILRIDVRKLVCVFFCYYSHNIIQIVFDNVLSFGIYV